MTSPNPGKRRMDTDVIKLIESQHEVTILGGLNEFMVRFYGPKTTSYDGGVWKVRVDLPDKYPFKSPSIGFMNRIFHPNIDEASGTVCLDVINQTWTPMYDLVNVFESFLPQLLTYPNPVDPLNGDAAALYLHKPEEYKAKVREYVKKYATDEALKAQEQHRSSNSSSHHHHNNNNHNSQSSTSSSSPSSSSSSSNNHTFHHHTHQNNNHHNNGAASTSSGASGSSNNNSTVVSSSSSSSSHSSAGVSTSTSGSNSSIDGAPTNGIACMSSAANGATTTSKNSSNNHPGTSNGNKSHRSHANGDDDSSSESSMSEFEDDDAIGMEL